MAYGVYWRNKGDKTFKRATESVIATKGKFKGSYIGKDLRYETYEEALEKATKYEAIGYEVKIKEVK